MSRRIVYPVGVAVTLAVLVFLGTLPANAVTFSLISSVSQDTPLAWFGPVGLTIARIFEDPSRADVINFSDIGEDEYSGFAFEVPLGKQSSALVPAFVGVSTSPQTSDTNARFVLGNDAQTVGLELNLLGGDASIGLQSTGASFESNPLNARIEGPAVFDFYNFPNAPGRIASANPLAFGVFGNHALAPTLSASTGTNADESALSSPLVSSLSPQGPFWYGAYAPATRGETIQLSVPFKLAKIPVKVRFGEQSEQQVQSSSLATQILGPAFASSANYSSLSGGVTLALPLLTRRATVSLDGLYESLQNQKIPFGLTGSAQPAALAGATSPVVYYPNLTDMQQYVGAASVALPVTRSLTVNGSFSEQVYGGVDLNTLTQSLSQHKTAYGGGVVYNIPKTHSSINLFFNRNVYTDDNAPTYNFTENQQNLYFSVKF